jgi:hypothetical protein
MSATLTLDASGFRRALGGLARFSGRDLRKVILAETGSILKACAGDTKVGTQKSAEKRATARALHSITFNGKAAATSGFMTVNSGARGGTPGWMWHRTKRGKFQTAGLMNLRNGNRRWANIHFRDDDWQAMVAAADKAKAKLLDLVPAAKRSLGLARQSWVQIADDLGIALEAVPGGRISAQGIAKARAALASNGLAYANGEAREYGEARAFFVELVNRLPYGRKIALDRILVKNINARVRFFEQNLARGVFDRLHTFARAYPGLEVRRAA